MAHAPNKDISCEEESKVMRVSSMARNERVYTVDSSAKGGKG